MRKRQRNEGKEYEKETQPDRGNKNMFMSLRVMLCARGGSERWKEERKEKKDVRGAMAEKHERETRIRKKRREAASESTKKMRMEAESRMKESKKEDEKETNEGGKEE